MPLLTQNRFLSQLKDEERNDAIKAGYLEYCVGAGLSPVSLIKEAISGGFDVVAVATARTGDYKGGGDIDVEIYMQKGKNVELLYASVVSNQNPERKWTTDVSQLRNRDQGGAIIVPFVEARSRIESGETGQTRRRIEATQESGGTVLQNFDVFLEEVSAHAQNKSTSDGLKERREAFAKLTRNMTARLGALNEATEASIDAITDPKNPFVTFGDQSFLGRKFRRMEKALLGQLLREKGLAVAIGDDPLDYVRDKEMTGFVIPNPHSKVGFKWMSLVDGGFASNTIKSLPLPSSNVMKNTTEEMRFIYKSIMAQLEQRNGRKLKEMKEVVLERVESIGMELMRSRNAAYSQGEGLSSVALIQQQALMQKMEVALPIYSYAQKEMMVILQRGIEKIMRNGVQVATDDFGSWVPFSILAKCGTKIALRLQEDSRSTVVVRGRCSCGEEEVNSSLSLTNPDLDSITSSYAGIAVDKYSRYLALQSELSVDGYIVGGGGISYMPAVVEAAAYMEPIAPIAVSNLRISYTGPAQELARFIQTPASRMCAAMSRDGDFSAIDAEVGLGDLRNVLEICRRRVVGERIPLNGSITINEKFIK